MDMTTTALSGMKEIVEYCAAIGLRRTETSVLKLVVEEGFPARKLMGVWESDRKKIDEWRQSRFEGARIVTPPEKLKQVRRGK